MTLSRDRLVGQRIIGWHFLAFHTVKILFHNLYFHGFCWALYSKPNYSSLYVICLSCLLVFYIFSLIWCLKFHLYVSKYRITYSLQNLGFLKRKNFNSGNSQPCCLQIDSPIIFYIAFSWNSCPSCWAPLLCFAISKLVFHVSISLSLCSITDYFL